MGRSTSNKIWGISDVPIAQECQCQPLDSRNKEIQFVQLVSVGEETCINIEKLLVLENQAEKKKPQEENNGKSLGWWLQIYRIMYVMHAT